MTEGIVKLMESLHVSSTLLIELLSTNRLINDAVLYGIY